LARNQTAKEGKVMQLSTRNILKGKVVDVKEGMIMAKVKVDIGGGNIVTAIITDESLKELGVKVGDELAVLIKATSVMVAKDIR
jgi:molybdopterin-binding protein